MREVHDEPDVIRKRDATLGLPRVFEKASQNHAGGIRVGVVGGQGLMTPECRRGRTGADEGPTDPDYVAAQGQLLAHVRVLGVHGSSNVRVDCLGLWARDPPGWLSTDMDANRARAQ